MGAFFLSARISEKEGFRGQAHLSRGDKLFGDLQDPPLPIDISVSGEGILCIRPARDGAIASAQRETVVEGNPDDNIEPLVFENSPLFQEVPLLKRSNLRIKGSDGSTIVIYP